MEYEVLVAFRDLETGKEYSKGQVFKGKLTNERKKTLTTKDNVHETVFLKEKKKKKGD